MLKVLKLQGSTIVESGKPLPTAGNLSGDQTLEGHNGSVKIIVWNEAYQKLTSSDQFGYIIVFMLHKSTWYEEMINSRNKSVVTDMAWNQDGSKICIVYEDGVVIVGTVDGNRIWGREIKASLVAVQWSPGGRSLIFGLGSGEVHVYDSRGNFLSKLSCPTNGEAHLASLDWFCPVNESDEEGRLAIVYQQGVMQIMRSDVDPEPIIVRHDKFQAVVAKWDPRGSILALVGKKLTLPENEQNIVYFVNTIGEHLRMLKLPGKDIGGCSWEGDGLRIAFALDSHIYFANLRLDYKWGFYAHTVVYGFRKVDRIELCVGFWDTKMNEVNFKFVRDLKDIVSYGDYCTLISKCDDDNGKYLLQLCNGIGTPVDYKYLDFEPSFVTMNSTFVVVATKEAFFLWPYTIPRKLNRDVNASSMSNKFKGMDKIYHIDQPISEAAGFDPKKAFPRNIDPICCIHCSDSLLLIARESSSVSRYTLPNLGQLQKITLGSRPGRMILNSNDT